MRIYKCNRCNTTFINPGKYSILKKGTARSGSTAASPSQWVDLCTTCTNAFVSWLNPSSQEGREASE